VEAGETGPRGVAAIPDRDADDRGFARFEWVVLDWNQPAIDFYDALGGKPMGEWTTYRVDGDLLTALARG
jgi:hypothetical protein